MSYTKHPKTAAQDGAMLSRLHTNKIMSATALSTVLTFLISILWHRIFFEKAYHELFHGGEEQQQSIQHQHEQHHSSSSITIISIISVLIQNFTIAFAFSLAKIISKSSTSLQFLRNWTIPVLALYHWSISVLGYVGEGIVSDMVEYRVEFVLMYALLESCYEMLHFTVVGLVVVLSINGLKDFGESSNKRK